MNTVEIIDRQTEIIKIQAGIIDELYSLLSQHITAAELGKLPVFDKISTTFGLIESIEEGGGGYASSI